jgi:hypothetical protein
MDDTDLFVIKRTLQALLKIGSQGLRKDDLLDQAELAAGRPLTSEQRERAFAVLRDRKWIEGHLEPILHHERWTLTERGLTTLESL